MQPGLFGVSARRAVPLGSARGPGLAFFPLLPENAAKCRSIRQAEPSSRVIRSEKSEGTTQGGDPQGDPIILAHANDMLVAAAGGGLFVSDLYSPGLPGVLAPLVELRDALGARPDVPVAQIAGGHGGVASPADLDALIASLRP
jgi:hypothetical protein